MPFVRPDRIIALSLASLLVYSATAAGQQRPPVAPAEKLAVAYKDGLVTVNVRDAPLTDLLNWLSREARVAIVEVEGPCTSRVSEAFDNLPVDAALRRLLKDCDSFMFFGVGQAPPASVQVVWVYSRGRGRGVVPVPPQAWASSTELYQRLEGSADPQERAAMIEAIVERNGAGALDAVQWALGDVDSQVRSRALGAAIQGGVDVSPELLMQAFNDTSNNVRFLALDALAAGPQGRAVAERALNDPDPFVQRRAHEILDRLRSAERPPSPQPAAGSKEQRE